MVDTPDFGPTEYSRSTAEQTARLDVDLSDVLAQLQQLNVKTALIQSATIALDLPLRYRSGVPFYNNNFYLGAGNWVGTGYGTGWSSYTTTAFYYTSGRSWRLKAGSDGARLARATLKLGPYPKCKVGIEAAFTLTNTMDTLTFTLMWPYGGYDYFIIVYIDHTNTRICLRDQNYNVQAVLSPWGYMVDDNAFHFLKIIADLNTEQYETIYLNEHELDVSQYGIYSENGNLTDSMELEVELHSQAGVSPIVYFTDICLTKED